MAVLTENRIAGVVHATESLLSQRAGTPVVLADPEDLGGSGRTTVVRVRVARNPVSMDRSLVIKALPEHENPDAFRREIASYKYATALPTGSRPGPQLIASDVGLRLLVLSDLGHGRSMSALLADSDPVVVTRAVSAWGQALGRLHAATVGGEGDFGALARLADARYGGALHDDATRVVGDGPARSADIGVAMPDDVAATLAGACTLFDQGEYRAFSPCDVGPENILINEDGVQFMDYEWGRFRDATLDIGYALVTFADRLNALGRTRRLDLEVSMVDAWRSEVYSIWPSLRRDREMVQTVTAARLLWVWLSTAWMLPGSDPDLSDETFAQTRTADDLALHTNNPRVIVSRWDDLASAARGAQARVADFATDMGAALRQAWLA